jgi:hypothetical protein
VSRVLEVDGPFGQFSRRLLTVELPALPAERLDATVAFVCRRAALTPGPLRVGVVLLAGLTGLAERVVDADRVTEFLRTTSLPVLGELGRLVRSLAFAFVWETWPSTAPTGAAGAPEAA